MSMGNTAFGVPMQLFYGRYIGESPVARMAAGPLNRMGQRPARDCAEARAWGDRILRRANGVRARARLLDHRCA